MKIPRQLHNPISYGGALIAGLAGLIFLFLVVLDLLNPTARAPYASILIFMVVPTFIFAGLALIPLGWWVAVRRHRRTGRQWLEEFPVVDFNLPRHQRVAAVIVLGGLLMLFLSAFSAYEVYEATESVAFCGQLCHTPMEPENVAYQHSAHARVRCVECHVGGGAEWYVRSKVTGMRRVYGVLLNNYERPIPLPVSDLRPAQDTCEQCHWPEKFWDSLHQHQVHFLRDDDNTRWDIDLVIKVGGGGAHTSNHGGIHWHMNNQVQMEFISTDPQNQSIPWVRSVNRKTGKSIEYMSTDSPLSDEDRQKAKVQRMDCMDCHNRPAHIYRAPSVLLNGALANGKVSPALPAIKSTAIDLMTAEYSDKDAAFKAIDDGIKKFYAENHADVAAKSQDDITAASAEIQRLYSISAFPAMKVRWDTYPNNIGHLMFPGCFRCHDGLHKSPDGDVIRQDCNLCHTIVAQGKVGEIKHAETREGLEFEHPGDIGDAWRDSGPCTTCHNGATP